MMQNSDLDKIKQQIEALENQSIKLDVNLKEGSLDAIKSEFESLKSALDFGSLFLSVDKAAMGLDSYAAKTSRIFGTTKDQVSALKTIVADSFASVTMMGGTLLDVEKSQDALTKTFNTNVLATKKNIEDLTLTNKTTGIAAETLVSGFRSAGFSVSHIKDEMQKVVDYSRSVGANVSVVAELVTKNIEKLNLYNFDNGVQGLSKMAAQSSVLGIDMGKTFEKAEQLLDPEKAIDFAASLQRLGATSSQLLDPLRVMDLAQNDPAELQNQMVELSKQFVRTKEDGSFEILPGAQRQLREIAGVLGLNKEELAKMALNSAEVGRKMSEIRFPSFDISEENKSLIANMAQFNKGTGQYEITYTTRDKETGMETPVTKVVSEIPPDDLEAIVQASKPKSLEELNQSQLSIQQKMLIELETFNKTKVIGAAASEMGQGMIRTIAKELISTTTEITSKAAKDEQNQTRIAFDQSLKKYLGKEDKKMEGLSSEDLMGLIREQGFELLKKSVTDVADAGTKFVETFSDVVKGLEIVPDTLKNNLDKLNLAIQNNTNYFDNLNQQMSDDFLSSLTQRFNLPSSNNTSSTGQSFNLSDINSILEGMSTPARDFVVTENEVIKYDEGDIVIGTKKPLMDNSSTDITSLESSILRSNLEKESPGIVSLDTTPLTEIMKNYVMSNTPKENEKLEIVMNQSNQEKGYDFTTKIEELLTNMTSDNRIYPVNNLGLSEIKELINDMVSKTEGSIEQLMEMSKVGEYKTPLEVVTKNIVETNVTADNMLERPRPTTSPETNMASVMTTRMESETPKNIKNEIVFGDPLKIQVTVDLQNAGKVDSEEVQRIMEKTFSGIDFGQHLVKSLNIATSNSGVNNNTGTRNFNSPIV